MPAWRYASDHPSLRRAIQPRARQLHSTLEGTRWIIDLWQTTTASVTSEVSRSGSIILSALASMTTGIGSEHALVAKDK